jgi:putative oxidoreductase
VALSRRLARPLLGAVFVAGGIDTLRNPRPRVRMSEDVGPKVARRLGLPDDPDTVVKINAGVQIGAGLMLATGRFPRLAALALLGSLVPTTIAGHRFWALESPEQRAQQRTHFLKNAGLAGGLILAAVDTEGRPGLSWRARHAAKHARQSALAARASASDVVDDFTDRLEDLTKALTERLPG